MWPFVSFTLNTVLGRTSITVPSHSITSLLARIIPPLHRRSSLGGGQSGDGFAHQPVCESFGRDPPLTFRDPINKLNMLDLFPFRGFDSARPPVGDENEIIVFVAADDHTYRAFIAPCERNSETPCQIIHVQTSSSRIGEDDNAVFGDRNSVFVVSGKAAVAGDNCPVIVENAHLEGAGGYHRFDGYRHTRADP